MTPNCRVSSNQKAAQPLAFGLLSDGTRKKARAELIVLTEPTA